MLWDLPVLPKSQHAYHCQRWNITWDYHLSPTSNCILYIQIHHPPDQRTAIERQFGRWCEQRSIHHPNISHIKRFMADGYKEQA